MHRIWHKAPERELKVTHAVYVHYGEYSYVQCFNTREKALWFAGIAHDAGCRVYL